MATKALVIVESPTKARTIKRFLPKGYHVEASVGHVRDLPQSAGEIPKRFKGEPWARLGIDVENEFKPLYVTPKGKSKVINELKKKVREADVLLLATDEDREGESISWHLVEVLKPKVPVKRMVFHEITKRAIEHSMEHYREIDMNLVRAQETRRILDRLYGYTLSPLIWKKIAYGLSAGRVQSPGLRMIVERERERIRFHSSVYWDLKATLAKPQERSFEAKLLSVGEKRVAGSKDFDSTSGKLKDPDSVLLLSQEEAGALLSRIEKAEWKVLSVQQKETASRPAAPFITSSLQQEGNRKLGLSARETMRIAQRLYEEGLITYMRTDSPALSSEAIGGARSAVENLYGKEYLSETPRQYSSKSRGAQEAHEAIRPAGGEFVHPDNTNLTGKDKGLYQMIWKRTIASQMAEAKKLSVSVRIGAEDAVFAATGNRIIFPGFLRVYVEGKDDPEAALEDKEVLLPPLAEGDRLELVSLEPDRHETKPPARYTEASLVQRLEKEGIGRPSTYATIISTIYERGYIRRQGTSLVPTFTGMAVVQLLEEHFDDLVDYGFTSSMEAALDQIAYGEKDNKTYLKEFYFGPEGLREEVEQREAEISPERSRTVALPQLKEHQAVKVGRYGPYIVHREGEEAIHASIPEEIAPADLTEEDITELIEVQKRGPEPIGTHPETGEKIYCLTGRYGPYVQLGEATEDKPKPKRAGLPKGVKPSEVDVELATKLLSLPRTLGEHPETGEEVVANVGRFGPFVVSGGEFRSLKSDDDVYTITLDRALELLSEEKKGGRKRSKLLKELGQDPNKKRKLAVYDGKYGPYIKAGTKNVSLPEEKQTEEAIEQLTLEEAARIVAAAGK
ncbi:MAG: type I DNA topoisomerase [Alkalispirochaetaceae bacterium]